jgi:hypothetical protein
MTTKEDTKNNAAEGSASDEVKVRTLDGVPPRTIEQTPESAGGLAPLAVKKTGDKVAESAAPDKQAKQRTIDGVSKRTMDGVPKKGL